MLKKLSVVALAGMLGLPAVALAGGGTPSPSDLQRQIDQLTRQLDSLKQQMEQVKQESEAVTGQVEDLGDQADHWNEASRFQWWGDFRARLDYSSADTPRHYSALDIGSGVADFYQLNTDFGTAATAQALASADRLADFNNATIGDILAAFGAGGVPTRTATANALTDLGAISGTLSTTQQNTVNALLPMLNPAMTMGQLSGAFSTTFADKTNIKPVVNFMRQFSPTQRATLFSMLRYNRTPATTYDNDTMWTNRLRLSTRVKVTENVTFKGRLAMYKAWGMQNSPVDYQFTNGMGGGPYMLSSLIFDGSSTRQPQDNVLRVDRAYVNWADIADLPIWFSIGRRPTTDGPPGHLRQGVDKRMATPTAFMDYPFDGATIGYAYDSLFGMEDFPGRIRFCYGRGFESGPRDDSANTLRDVDFGGISWDVYHKGDRFVAFQSFIANNMFNVPDNITFPNPIEFGMYQIDPGFYDPTDSGHDLILNRKNLGNIYHTTATFMDKKDNLNYFISGGWSHTDPNGMDELGTSLLGSFFAKPESQDGYAVYAGIRYDMPEKRLKLGLEYNYGSQYWIGFTPGHDDITLGKLATRGHVGEAYLVYDFPAGDKLSKYADFFMRLGYMHYKYNYTGSGFWLGEPIDIDELANDPLNAQFYTPIKDLDQVYLTVEAYF